MMFATVCLIVFFQIIFSFVCYAQDGLNNNTDPVTRLPFVRYDVIQLQTEADYQYISTKPRTVTPNPTTQRSWQYQGSLSRPLITNNPQIEAKLENIFRDSSSKWRSISRSRSLETSGYSSGIQPDVPGSSQRVEEVLAPVAESHTASNQNPEILEQITKPTDELPVPSVPVETQDHFPRTTSIAAALSPFTGTNKRNTVDVQDRNSPSLNEVPLPEEESQPREYIQVQSSEVQDLSFRTTSLPATIPSTSSSSFSSSSKTTRNSDVFQDHKFPGLNEVSEKSFFSVAKEATEQMKLTNTATSEIPPPVTSIQVAEEQTTSTTSIHEIFKIPVSPAPSPGTKPKSTARMNDDASFISDDEFLDFISSATTTNPVWFDKLFDISDVLPQINQTSRILPIIPTQERNPSTPETVTEEESKDEEVATESMEPESKFNINQTSRIQPIIPTQERNPSTPKTVTEEESKDEEVATESMEPESKSNINQTSRIQPIIPTQERNPSIPKTVNEEESKDEEVATESMEPEYNEEVQLFSSTMATTDFPQVAESTFLPQSSSSIQQLPKSSTLKYPSKAPAPTKKTPTDETPNIASFFPDTPTLLFFKQNYGIIIGCIVGLVIAILIAYVLRQRRFRSGKMTVCRATVDWQVSDKKSRKQPLLYTPNAPTETPLASLATQPDSGSPELLIQPCRLTTFIPTPPPMFKSD